MTSRTPSSSNLSNSANIDLPPRCGCNLLTWRGVSRTEKNPNRVFYKCINSDEASKESCGYWKWEDQLIAQAMSSQPTQTPTGTPPSSQTRQMWNRESTMKRKRSESSSETQESTATTVPGSQTMDSRSIYSQSQFSATSESPTKRFKASMPASEKDLWGDESSIPPNLFDEGPIEQPMASTSMGGASLFRDVPATPKSTKKANGLLNNIMSMTDEEFQQYQAHVKEKSLENLRAVDHAHFDDPENPFMKTSPTKAPETPIRSEGSFVLPPTPQTADEKRRSDAYAVVEGLNKSASRLEIAIESYERRLLANSKSIETKDQNIHKLRREQDALKERLTAKEMECDELQELVASLRRENGRLRSLIEDA